MLFPIGISNLVNFVFHVFFGDTAAKFIGWDKSPFQTEVGFASLGVGIAGVLAYKASLPFRVATFATRVHSNVKDLNMRTFQTENGLHNFAQIVRFDT